MAREKELTGTVISDKMQKTIVVRVWHKTKHPRYGRPIKTSNTFKVHDEKQAAHIGDTVRIVHTRPLSKEKFFMLAGVVKKAQTAGESIGEGAL